MHISLLSSSALVLALANAHPSKRGIYDDWKPPGPNDLRGPCPMMNTLANHGFLPRDGRGLTRPVVQKALLDSLSFDNNITNVMFDQALPANPEPNATFFTLDMLNRHNVLEHDASLTRPDHYFSSVQNKFNATIFSQSIQYWTTPTIDRYQIVNSKLARQLDSKATNPTYRFTSTVEQFSVGEILAPFVALGDRESVTVDRDSVIYWMTNERLPLVYGFQKPETISLPDILRLSEILGGLSTLITSDNSTESVTPGTHAKRAKRMDSHFGLF